MKILTPHRQQSQLVKTLQEIIVEANEMSKYVNAELGPKDRERLAIHHSQVSENPKNFFVVNRKFAALFGGRTIIINPKLVKRDDPVTLKELCMSYPHRPPKKVTRYKQIVVEFDVENDAGNGLLHVGDFSQEGVNPYVLRGLAAQIFMHEYDHGHAQYIYDQKNK